MTMGPARFSTVVRSVELAWGGKLPSMGDFIWSNRRTALRTRLDSWLFSGMHQFRLTHGDNWQSGFDQAPMWNFIVPEGMWDQGCIAGCISPSCDRVGRRFPFIVAYELPERLPAWFFPKAVDHVPSLLARTGVLLFNGIRRNWPKGTLVPLIEQALVSWQDLLPLPGQDTNVPPNDSIIMDILMSDTGSNNAAATVPHNRSLSFPWNDVANHLGVGASSSFWWTNGAGNASLKAFSYDTHPDGTLMTWLFGRLPT
jgi:type VI secretion system protein ImpM